MPSAFLRALAGPDLAVDLGSATTRVASAAGGAPLAAPSTCEGRTALAGGVVVDVECAAAVLRPLFARLRRLGLARPRVVASAPSDAAPEERQAVEEAVRRAGAIAVTVYPEPLAAAVGSGIDLASPWAQLVVDVGHGVTDCAVLRSGGVVASRARRVGCGDLERAVREHVASRCGVEPTPAEVRSLLRQVWQAEKPGSEPPAAVAVRGCAVALAGLAADVAPTRDAIAGVVSRLLRDVPHDVGAELVESGIALTGGGALLPGLAACLARETGLSVRPVGDPLNAVVQGDLELLAGLAGAHAWARSRQAAASLWAG
jgi:rod shape-determining protein MreB